MTSFDRRRQSACARRMRGGALIGFVVGVLVGLGIAAFVAVYITRSPVPFVDRASRAPSPIAVPKSAEETPDPNRPLYSKTRPQTDAGEQPAAPPPTPRPEEESASILERLFGKGASSEASGSIKPAEPQVKGGAGAGDAKGAPAGRTAADAKVPAEPRAPGDAAGAAARGGDQKPADARPADAAGQTSYLLQAGAFRSSDEADAMKARLALLGLEARVLAAEVNGQTVYRVRVGPYAQLDEMNRARSRLAESGIEASVLRQK